jgi:brefeldin A-resistance guanine nucleotide exchange factor 1
VTVRELIRAVVKVVLLYSEAFQELSVFGGTWRAILDCLANASTCGAKSELLVEAIPEALKNMLLVLGSKVWRR